MKYFFTGSFFEKQKIFRQFRHNLKKYFIYIAIIICGIFSSSFNLPRQENQIIVQFISYNGFGNNLYIDNLTIGSRDSLDVAITSIKNIPRDTFYSPGLDTLTVTPAVKISNVGLKDISGTFHIIMKIPELHYSSDSTLNSLSKGQTLLINFETVKIYANSPFNFKVYSSLIDSNSTNDTLIQNSIMFNGAIRNVLLEEWTSATSISCGSNNPFLDNFINTNFSFLSPIKYHLGFPNPGIDPMYLANPVPQNQRKNYYNINSLPACLLDGSQYLTLPFNTDSGLITPINNRLSLGSPLFLNVTDTRLTGDTIQSIIDLNILHSLKPGNYKLRVMAIERIVNFSEPPGTNGEKTFYDVFRNSLIDSNGITINPNSGTYQFVYKYLRDLNWQDSMIYTLAFIQNDDTKEVINSAKGRNYAGLFSLQKHLPKPLATKLDINEFININNFPNNNPVQPKTVSGKFKYQLFESDFPPIGWSLKNSDIGFTFKQVELINGPSFGGYNCVQMPFYDYASDGQRDTLLSLVFGNILSTDTLKFDFAYAQYLSTYIDSLIVKISTDGGLTFRTIFANGGSTLATAPSTTLPFAPVYASEWKTFLYPLSNILPPEVSNNIPLKYELMQNYPNPFNPTTKISYVLPNSGFVTLKIYDISGREILTLINEQQTPGIKEIEFNGQNYSSGVYFYLLKVNDFRDVRKMVLVK